MLLNIHKKNREGMIDYVLCIMDTILDEVTNLSIHSPT